MSTPAELKTIIDFLNHDSRFGRNFDTNIQGVTDITQVKILPNKYSRLDGIHKASQLGKLNVHMYGDGPTPIPKQIGLLTNLHTLYLCSNRLTNLPDEIKYLVNLVEIKLNPNNFTTIPESLWHLPNLNKIVLANNKITTIPPQFCNLPKLQVLNLNSNDLTCLPECISNLTLLQRLWLSNNHLTNLPTTFSQLTNLKELDISNNQLTEIPMQIMSLTQLSMLYVNNNQITNIPTQIIQLTQLSSFSITQNKLTSLPICLIYLPRLSYFRYGDNEITDLPTPITRWLNQNKTVQCVYSNNQSVHDHNIESTTNESIKKFVMNYVGSNVQLDQILNDLNISNQTKDIIISYCSDNYIHSKLNLTFGEVATLILDYIANHTNKDDLTKILEEEMLASKGKCFQGRLSRLINIINGYHPDVNIRISDNEQIGNVILSIKKRFNDENRDLIIDTIKKELDERGYDNSTIQEWLGYVEEN